MNKNSSSEMGFASVLQLIFIVLKLCDVITWSWWWVLFPTWIVLLLLCIAVIVVFVLED